MFHPQLYDVVLTLSKAELRRCGKLVRSPFFTHRCVLVRSDNSGVVAAINSQSSRSPAAMRWLRHLFLTAMRHNILVRARHVPGVRNAAPDALSRGFSQAFRALRPMADAEPTPWDWADFSTLRP